MTDFGIVCGECGSPMLLRSTKKHAYPNGEPRKFYGCSRFPDCKGAHGAHPGGEPMGIPADKSTRQARVEAHAAFDAAVKARGMTRKQGYLWLQDITGLSKRAAHISRFSAKQCVDLTARITLLELARVIESEPAEATA